MDEYIIINKTKVLKRIEDLNKDVKFYSNENLKLEAHQCLGAVDSLNIILTQSVKLIPEIEKAFHVGRVYQGREGDTSIEDYTRNLKLNI